jgi:hypothetical protein
MTTQVVPTSELDYLLRKLNAGDVLRIQSTRKPHFTNNVAVTDTLEDEGSTRFYTVVLMVWGRVYIMSDFASSQDALTCSDEAGGWVVCSDTEECLCVIGDDYRTLTPWYRGGLSLLPGKRKNLAQEYAARSE